MQLQESPATVLKSEANSEKRNISSDQLLLNKTGFSSWWKGGNDWWDESSRCSVKVSACEQVLPTAIQMAAPEHKQWGYTTLRPRGKWVFMPAHARIGFLIYKRWRGVVGFVFLMPKSVVSHCHGSKSCTETLKCSAALKLLPLIQLPNFKSNKFIERQFIIPSCIIDVNVKPWFTMVKK